MLCKLCPLTKCKFTCLLIPPLQGMVTGNLTIVLNLIRTRIPCQTYVLFGLGVVGHDTKQLVKPKFTLLMLMKAKDEVWGLWVGLVSVDWGQAWPPKVLYSASSWTSTSRRIFPSEILHKN
jgi:hypothetical protein